LKINNKNLETSQINLR